MPLAWQNIHVNFGEGVDTNTDQKAVIATKLLKAQNVVFTAPGALRTRFGWEQAAEYPGAVQLGKHGDQLIAMNGNHVYPRPANTGTATSSLAGVQMTPLVREHGYVESECDSAVNGTIQLTVARLPRVTGGATGKLTVVVTDLATGRELQRVDSRTGITCTYPKVVSVGGSIWVFWLESAFAVVEGMRYTVATDSFGAIIQFTGPGVSGLYDICKSDGDTFVLTVQAPGFLVLYRKDETGATLTSTAIGLATAGHIASFNHDDTLLFVAYKNTGTGDLECSGFDLPALTTAFSGATIKSPYPTFFTQVEVVIGRHSATSARIIYRDQSATGIDVVESVLLTRAGNVGVTLYKHYRRRILSWPWMGPDGSMRLLVGYPDGLQGTAYVMSYGTTEIEAIVARGLSGIEIVGTIPRPSEVEDGVFLVPLATKQKVEVDRVGGDFFYTNESVGVDMLRIDHASEARYCTCELGGLTYIAGGNLMFYDGSVVGEVGFYLFPTAPVIGMSAGGAATIGTHQAVIVWTYVDAKGNVHRSAPSPATEFTVAAPNQTIGPVVDPLNMSGRESNTTGLYLQTARVFPEWYGTQANSAAPFYRVSPPGSCTVNDWAGELAFVVANNDDDDATIAANPQIYTAGGVLPNYPPPSTDCIFTHQNRILLISAEDGRIWFSKEYIVGEAPGFNDALTFALATSGRVVAGCSFDDKAVFWTDNAEIHVLAGEFPNDQGAGSSLHSERIASDVGARDWRSVRVTHLGAFFASEKGLMLLTRGLSVVPAGFDVDYWSDHYETVSASIVTPDRDEVRFYVKDPIVPVTTPSSQAVVLNFRAQTEASPFGQWSHFDDALGDVISTIAVAGTVYKLTTAGIVYRETTEYADAGAWITVDVETANIYPYGRQASCSIRTATLLGTSDGEHGLEMQLAYDDDPAFIESANFTADDLSVLPRLQAGHHLMQQKCSGVRLKFTTIEDGVSPNAKVSLSGVVLEAAQKRGSADRRAPKEARQ